MEFNDLNYSTENIIEFKDVKFQYVNPGPTVLDIEKLVVKKGERIAIIGPSGSGKTTLFRMINGYIQPDSGYIKILEYKYHINSLLPRSISRKIGFIFQDFNLIDRASVFKNVLWGRLGMVNSVLSRPNVKCPSANPGCSVTASSSRIIAWSASPSRSSTYAASKMTGRKERSIVIAWRYCARAALSSPFSS